MSRTQVFELFGRFTCVEMSIKNCACSKSPLTSRNDENVENQPKKSTRVVVSPLTKFQKRQAWVGARDNGFWLGICVKFVPCLLTGDQHLIEFEPVKDFFNVRGIVRQEFILFVRLLTCAIIFKFKDVCEKMCRENARR